MVRTLSAHFIRSCTSDKSDASPALRKFPPRVSSRTFPLLGSCRWIKRACALDWGCPGLVARQHIQALWFQTLPRSSALCYAHAKLNSFFQVAPHLAKNTRWRTKGLPGKPSNRSSANLTNAPPAAKTNPICPAKLRLRYTLPSGGVPCSKSLRVPC